MAGRGRVDLKGDCMGRARIQVARVYDDPGRSRDMYRVLVDRLWPRGVRKEALDLDEWAKDVAPSPGLRTWYGHAPERFEAFARRYRDELTSEPAAPVVDRLRRVSGRRTVLLMTATRDVEHSGASVLESVLRRSDG